MGHRAYFQMHSWTQCIGALIFAVISQSAAGASMPLSHRPATVQGRTWGAIKRLPDWSGVWVLSDESWAAIGRDADRAPFTARFHAISADHRAQPGGAPRFDNEAICVPVGIPESTGIPIGHEYLFTPGRVTVIFENGTVRHIDTSGRPHPSEKKLNPTFAGNSIGHWEGRTLVVDTIGISPQAEFLIGLHVTARTHLTERIFRKDRDTLKIDTVMTDPEIFTKPYIYSRLYKRYTSDLGEYYPCNQSNRDITVNGLQTGVDLTPPPEQKP